ncbi:hypothetical protein THAOC_31342, partial [Thalassiosira oceanica]
MAGVVIVRRLTNILLPLYDAPDDIPRGPAGLLPHCEHAQIKTPVPGSREERRSGGGEDRVDQHGAAGVRLCVEGAAGSGSLRGHRRDDAAGETRAGRYSVPSQPGSLFRGLKHILDPDAHPPWQVPRCRTRVPPLLVTRDHILLVYQVRRLLDQSQQALDVGRPVAQHLLLGPPPAEPHDVGRPVDLRVQRPARDHGADVPLRLLGAQRQELGEAGRPYLAVVDAHRPEVVLDYPRAEGLPPVLGGGRAVLPFVPLGERRDRLEGGLVGRGVVYDLVPQVQPERLLALGYQLELRVGVNPDHHVLDVVRVLGEAEEEDGVRQRLLPLGLVVLDGRRGVDRRG